MNRISTRILALALALALCVSLLCGMSGVFAVESTGSTSDGSFVVQLSSAVTATGGTYYVRSVDDLIELAGDCTIDSYSEGVNVILTTDLDLSDSGFTSIPIFSGTFEGGGHTISGLVLDGSASHCGLFRYVSETGTVRNLTVTGTVTPSGSGEYVGGIAGNNSGTISSCTFSGTVKGVSCVGGIAGTNEETGAIDGCRVYGYVQGERYVGGIVGHSLGMVSNCSNAAAVNTLYVATTSVSVDSLSLTSLSSSSVEDIESCTNIGGVAGFSTGVIKNCSNTGDVGYDHVGYNIGGVAGRQSGYIVNCENAGTIKGRKEVGGIVGQMEPYLELDLDSASAENLSNELNLLHDLLNKTLNDAQSSSNTITARLNAMSGYMGAAVDDMDYLAKNTVQFVDDTMEEVNDIADRIDYVMNTLPETLDHLIDASNSMTASIKALEDVNKDLDIVGKMETSLYDETDYYLLTITTGTGGSAVSSNMNPAAGQTVTITVTPETGYKMSSISVIDADGNSVSVAPASGDKKYDFIMPTESGDPINDPVNAVAKNTVVRIEFTTVSDYASVTGNTVAITSNPGGKISASNYKAAAGETVTLTVSKNEGYDLTALAITDVNGDAVAFQKLNNSNTSYSFVMPSGGLASVKGTFSREDNWTVVEQAADDMDVRSQRLQTNMASVISETKEILTFLGFTYDEATDTWTAPSKIDLNKKERAQLYEMLANLANDGLHVAEDMTGIIADLNTIIKVVAPFVTEAAKKANEDLAIALQNMEDASNSLTKAMSSVKSAVDYLNGLDNVEFPTLGSEYTQKVDSLCTNLKSMSNSLSALSGDINTASTLLISDLKAVNDQFNVVMLMLVDAIDGLSNTSFTDRYTDVSDETEVSTDGRVSSCDNSGTVTGDINVGGIAGAMAIEYDFDPESELTKTTGSLTQKYLTKCNMDDCENKGVITVKNDCAGSIVGYMELGSISECRGFGSVKSETGDYVGGIAGNAQSATLRDCWSMCTLTGASYVGGIAGYGTNIYDCHSLVSVESGSEFIGAIAGDYDTEDGTVSGCSFVSDDLQGIDGISYSGRAEPIPYASLLAIEGVPRDFRNLTLTFVADGKVIGMLSFEYGGSVSVSDIPSVPEKDGFSGSWPEFATTDLTFSRTIEAEYISLNTTLASAETRGGSDLSVILVEGDFHPGATVSAAASDSEYALASSKQTVLEILQVKIDGSNDSEDAHTVHYLAPDTTKKLSNLLVYVDSGDGWKQVSYSTSGKYLLFDVTGDNFDVCAVEQASNAVWYLVGGGAALAAVIIAIAATSVKRKKSKAHHTAAAAAAK